MGVYSNPNVDFAAIGSEMGATIAGWFNASVDILDPNLSETEWNPFTNEQTFGTPTEIWSGPARIQPLGSNANPIIGYSEEADRMVQVQVPLDIDAGFIRKGLVVTVTSPGNDYMLDGAEMTIVGSINSSYAWCRTIMCRIDLKVGEELG